MPFPFASQIITTVGQFALGKLFSAFQDDDGPEVAAYEARGEVRSEVVPRRWVMGTARVAGVLARHADMVHPEQAQRWWDANSDEGENDRVRGATERMRLYGYFGYVLSEGETEGVREVWVDGVKMPIAFNSNSQTVLRDGEFGPPARLNPQAEPFFLDQYETRPPGSSTVGVVTYNGTPLARRPALAFWQSKGEAYRRNLPALVKLREAYDTGVATDDEKADVSLVRGEGLTWVLARLAQSNVDDQAAPWRRVPQLDFLVKGKGPAAPEGVAGHLLDGNPAKAAYWVLTERMGVVPGLIDDVWKHSVAICDEPFLASAVSTDTTPTSAELRRYEDNDDFKGVIDMLAQESDPALDTSTDAGLAAAITAWKLNRLRRVVERYSGVEYALVDAETRASIVARWNERFTGSPTDEDGERPRYRANGVISSQANPRQVLEQLAQSMAGSIEEHGGRWYIRAGSLTLRPANVITDEDIVEDSVRQQLEPNVEDQPTEMRARLVQNERLDFERYVLEPVTRVEANLGEIDATNRPAFLREANPSPDRVRDMGDLVYVTDPLQADELMRIALYRTRWNTRTIYLVVKPNRDFSFYALGKGAPVLVNSKDEEIMGERVGERTDSMRCVVIETPTYDEAGNIELVLQQQDEEVFGEKFGLVLDYHDAGDVILVPPPTPPPPEPPTCAAGFVDAAPGDRVEYQVIGAGGTGRLTFGLQWRGANPGLVIDSSTGIVVGNLPGTQVVGTYVGAVTVTDSKGRTGSCTLQVGTTRGGGEPYILVEGLGDLPPGGTGQWTARVVTPEVLAPAFIGTRSEEWTFPALPTTGIFSVTTTGAGTTTMPADAPTGRQYTGTLNAYHPTRFLTISTHLASRAVSTVAPCNVNFKPITAKRGRVLNATSIFASTHFGSGSTSPAKVTEEGSVLSTLGLVLSEAGEVSGSTLTTAPLGRHRINVTITDSSSPAVTCSSVGAFDVFVSDVVTPPTVTVPSQWTIGRSGVETETITTSGFSGSLTCTIQGPSWLTCNSAADTLTAATGRVPGEYPYTVTVTDGAGGRARASGNITVQGTVVQPLTVEDKLLDAKHGLPVGRRPGSARRTPERTPEVSLHRATQFRYRPAAQRRHRRVYRCGDRPRAHLLLHRGGGARDADGHLPSHGQRA